MLGERAVVVGGSIAGLVSAQALGPHFEEVLVLERDQLPAGPDFRAGAAQGHHAHILLRRGLLGFDELVPGFSRDLLAHGAVKLNASRDWYSLFPRGQFPTFDSDLDFICASRGLIEFVLRTLVLRNPRIRLVDRCTVTAVSLSDAQPPVITMRNPDGELSSWTSSLCIDASGRNSRADKWLAASGFPLPRAEVVSPYLGYATRLFQNVSLDEPIRATVLLADSGGLPRGGVMFPIEGDRHIVTLYGFSRDYPPTDEAGFLSYALSLRAPLIHNAIRHASPVSPIHAFQKNEARFSRYGSAARWPMNFLVTGDAVASFNPIYGQGMTAALLAGEALRTALEAVEGEGRADALAIQRRITAAYRVPWQIARSEDLRWPATKWDGLRWPVRLEHRLGNMIGRAAACDPVVTQAYIEVLHLLRPPGSLVRPSMLWRILLHRH